MDHSQARRYIDECYKQGSVYGLEAVTALVKAMGEPQNGQNIIHIAGTNGKGSVGAFIAAVLTEAGYSTGRFISPSVFCYEERFQLNGEYIKNDDLADIITAVANAAEGIAEQPTGFELETAAALYYFKSKKCDFSLVECGLGGRADATNVIANNLIEVITHISLDHTALLGNTLAEIAAEKCGIIKQGTAVVSAQQSSEAAEVIKECCKQQNAVCNFVNNSDIRNIAFDGTAQSFDYKGFKGLKTRMLGKYQTENAALAVECITALRKKGFGISDKAVYDGLYKASWGARFEIVYREPLFILDGAHNPDGAKRLKESLDLYFKDRKKLFITGVFADKDYDGILKCLAPMADKIYAIQAPTSRGLAADKLAEAIKKYNTNVVISDINTAVKQCMGDKEHITAVFGSLSFMGQIREYISSFKE